MRSYLIIFSFITLLLNGCSSDNTENIDVSVSNLLGTWDLVEMTTQNGTATITEDGNSITVDFSLETSNENLQINFNEDPDTVTSQGSFTQITTVSILGQSETEETTIQGDFLEGDWELVNNRIIISSTEDALDDFMPSFEIMEITETTLVLRQSLDMQNIFESDGTEISGILIIRFQR